MVVSCIWALIYTVVIVCDFGRVARKHALPRSRSKLYSLPQGSAATDLRGDVSFNISPQIKISLGGNGKYLHHYIVNFIVIAGAKYYIFSYIV